ncbi:MAG: bifunctional phosphopantothenoylcysteine decarboxylase/phosphopantothenate--cysteine ligase CoaBC [Bacteroidota bacterium]
MAVNSLNGKKVILAITGSIAAYKCAILTRLLIKQGAEVQVVMTPAATDFISPLTLSTLSKHPVLAAVSTSEGWNNHVELGLWADVMIIAPATANTLSKMANGLCDNMVLAVYLSARCPVCFAPAMDLDMWTHPSTQHNVERLLEYGNHLIPVEHGELASGLVGKGRMAEPESICNFISHLLESKKDLAGTTFLMTSGPTRERLDPVRYLSNRSTGRMGTAIAEELQQRGARVIFITGIAQYVPSGENIRIIQVESAQEMYDAAVEHYPATDGCILTAAVADYRPATISDKKIKKQDGELSIALERTPDIAKKLGQLKSAKQLNVGFALETHDEEKNAKGKLERKNFDLIVLNSLNDPGAGFAHATNKVSIMDKQGKVTKFELKSKQQVAVDIVDKIVAVREH